MLLLELYFLLDVMMILATITLTFSLNNVILLINFLSMITIVGIELSVSNIEITLLILVIYESSLLCLFLVNGILLMSSSLYRIHSLSLIRCIDPIIVNNWRIISLVYFQWSFSISLIGVLIVSCSCFRFFDLKKIIAFSSILHLNLTLVSIYSLNSIGVLSGIITSISHGFSSVGLFLFSFLLILPARLFILQHNIRSFYYSWMSFFLY